MDLFEVLAKALGGEPGSVGALSQRVLLLQSAPVLVRDPQDRIIYWNPGCEALYGFTAAEAIGRVSHELLQTRFQEPFEQILGRLHVAREWRGKMGHIRKEGTQIFVDSRWLAHLDLRGNLQAIIEINSDITERKQAEEALAKTTARFNGIIASAMDAIITIDAGQRVMLFNPAAERMFGVAAEAAVGQSLSRFIPERFRAGHAHHVERFGQTGVSNRHMGALGTVYGLRANGQEFPIEASISQVDVYGEKLFTVILRDITQRQRDEAVRSRLAAIVESSEDAILSKSLTGIVITWNAGAERLLGYRAEEIIGQPVSLIIPPDRQAEAAFMMERIRRGEVVEHYETVRLAKSGRRIDVSLTISALRDAVGVLVGASTVIRDITKLKQVEAELRASERVAHRQLSELETVFERVPVGLSFLDTDLRYVRVNERLAEINGRSVEEHLGRTVREVLPEQADILEPMFRNILQTNAPVKNMEIHGMRPAEPNLERYWLASYFPVKDAEVRYLNGIVVEITERKRAEAAIQSSEVRYRRLFEAAQDAVLLLDLRTRKIRDANPAMTRLLGGPREELVGRELWEIGVLKDAKAQRADFEQLQQQGFLRYEELPLHSKAGHQREVELTANLYEEAGQPVIQCNLRDVTERKQAERALREALEQLARAKGELETRVQERTAELREKVGELEAFSYSLSHDLRAPIRAIASYSQLVLSESGDKLGSPAAEFLRKAVTAASNMDRLIQEVLTLSRLSLEEIQVGPADVEKLLREILRDQPELQAPKAEVRIESPLLPMLGHEASLRQCLSNLLANAVKFVAPGVKPQVRISTEPRGEKVRLWVEDNGIGIQHELQERVFNIFQRLHQTAEYEGTGIGLAIVRKAIERMGGEVGVESEPGQGSRFWLELEAPQTISKAA